MPPELKNYAPFSDEMLFNRYIGGDVDAFDELLNRCKNLVYSLILRYVSNAGEADDLFQDIFFKVCKNKDQFRHSISFKSWLVTVVRNTCIDYLRHKGRSGGVQSLDNDSGGEQRQLSQTLASDELGPDESLAIQLENDELEGLLDKLPAEQRDTFYLKVVMELTFEEIGASMNCSANTAKSRYRYALQMLRGLVRRKRLLEKAVWQ